MRHLHILPSMLFLSLSLTGQQQVTPLPSADQAQKEHTLSVDFKGGSLADYAAALRAAGKSVNIVVPESASRVRVPAIVLRDTSVEAALRAATQVVDGDVALAVETSIGSLPNVGVVGEPVYSVRVRASGPTTATGYTDANRSVRVFSLRGLSRVAGEDQATQPALLDIKTVLTALDTGLAVAAQQGEQLTGASEKAVLRLHEDSGLLFVAGTNAQLRLVDEVLANLGREVKAASRQEAGRRGARANEGKEPADDPAEEPATSRGKLR
ncbi:MAG: hypothetical protein R3F56_23855 [Planctomycetota bacterium]